MKAYLDIETSFSGRITVIGVFRPDQGFRQFWGEEVSKEGLLEFLKGTSVLTTYNGSRFDLPVINRFFGIRLDKLYDHRDLLFDCWNFRLYGGMKAVEKERGIHRNTDDVDGFIAMELWERFEKYNDLQALERLLSYNREDVINLAKLEEKLNNFYQLEILPFAREL